MTIETEVAALTTATNDLLAAVNVGKATLDTSVATATTKAGEAADSAAAAATTLDAVTIAHTDVMAAKIDVLDAKAEIRNAYYGPLAADPTTRPDGAAMQVGDEYHNSTTHARKVYNGADWIDVSNQALLGAGGAALVGYGADTVEGALDARLPEIATYAALRAYSGPLTGFYVRGVSSLFDGGAGVFRVDSTDTTSADNGGTVLVDALGRRWKREFSGAVNVRWFGAACDGVTDDSAAYQLALDAVPYAGELVIHGGVCESNLTLDTDNVTINLGRSTWEIAKLAVNGSGARIVGHRAQIRGKLKMGRLAAPVSSGATTWTLDTGHDLEVGQHITSSYFTDGDSYTVKPVVLTVVGNTITTDVGSQGEVPAGAYIGNFGVGATVDGIGDGLVIEGVDFRRCAGYALAVKQSGYLLSDCTIDENGFDLVIVTTMGDLTIRRCRLLRMYDAAKQAVSMTGAANLFVDESYFSTGNYDSCIYVFGATTSEAALRIRASRFNGVNAPELFPPPYSGNNLSAVFLASDDGAQFGSIHIDSDSHFTGFKQGILTRPAGTTNVLTLFDLRINDTLISAGPLGDLRKTILSGSVAQMRHIRNVGGFTDLSYFFLNDSDGSLSVLWESCEWSDALASPISNSPIILFRHSEVNGCRFKDCGTVQFEYTAFGSDNLFDESRIKGYPATNYASPLRLHGSKLKHSALTSSNDLQTAFIFSASNGASVPITLSNGSLPGALYVDNFVGKYVLYLRQSNGVISGLYKDDWRIPLRSVVEVMNNTVGQKYQVVNKSNATTLSNDAAASATVLSMTGVTGMANGDTINILQDNGTVHTTTISSIGGNDVTVSRGLSSPAALGAPVCAFTYTIHT